MTNFINEPQFASIHPKLDLAPDFSGVDFPCVELPDDAQTLLARRTYEIALIHEAGVRLTRELSLPAICHTLHTLIARVMSCDSFVVSSFSREDRLIGAIYVYHDGEEVDPAEFPPLPFNPDEVTEDRSGTQGRAIRTGKSLLLNDLEAYLENVPGYYYEDGKIYERDFERTPPEIETTRAALIVPLKLDQQVTGIVQVMSFTLGVFNLDQLRFLEALAPQVAIALQNGRLHNRLQALNDELARANSELEARVEARTEELRAALAEQRQISALKAHLVSMVSHEFRTPLTVIMNSADILDRYAGRLEPERRTAHVQRIQEQVLYLSAIVDNALTVSRAETAGLQPKRVVTDVTALVRQLCATLQADSPQRIIEFDIHGTTVPVLLDPAMLQQAVTNLLTNALKYSCAPHPVYCRLVFDAQYLQIQVEDHGQGIPEAELRLLFAPFHRASNVGSIKGTGLGLVIVKHVAEAHGGSITLQSAEGKGTTATLRLPLA